MYKITVLLEQKSVVCVCKYKPDSLAKLIPLLLSFGLSIDTLYHSRNTQLKSAKAQSASSEGEQWDSAPLRAPKMGLLKFELPK